MANKKTDQKSKVISYGYEMGHTNIKNLFILYQAPSPRQFNAFFDRFPKRIPPPCQQVFKQVNSDQLVVPSDRNHSTIYVMNALLWPTICQVLEQEILPLHFSLWILPLDAMENADELELSCDNDYVCEHVESQYLSRIRQVARELSGREWTVRITRPAPGRGPVQETVPSPAAEPVQGAGLRFPAGIVEGPENAFAWQAFRQVQEHPGRYNPLFVHGGSGTGKSFFLRMMHESYSRQGKKSLYIRGFEFYNQYIHAVETRTYQTFYQMFRGLDLLCIDDVHFFRNKDRTQETFGNIFHALYDSKAQILLSSDCVPGRIPGFTDALVSCFTWGLIVELSPPSMRTRQMLIECWGREYPPLHPEVVRRLVEHPFSSVRDFEGVLRRLWARLEIYHQPVGVREVQEELVRLDDTAPSTDLAAIEKLVCDHFRLTSDELNSTARSIRVARPRQVAMYLAKKYGRSSFPVIGEYFGRKTHSTVISACQKIDSLRKTDRQLSLDLEEIEKHLK